MEEDLRRGRVAKNPFVRRARWGGLQCGLLAEALGLRSTAVPRKAGGEPWRERRPRLLVDPSHRQRSTRRGGHVPAGREQWGGAGADRGQSVWVAVDVVEDTEVVGTLQSCRERRRLISSVGKRQATAFGSELGLQSLVSGPAQAQSQKGGD